MIRRVLGAEILGKTRRRMPQLWWTDACRRERMIAGLI